MKYLNLWLLVLILQSCAQFIPPTGGPKDEEPPKLIASFPENKTLSFKDKTITLAFDELIDAKSFRQELIITPEPDGIYDLKIKPYSVEIKFEEPFQDSTTYTFNFRQGIKDLNERNPAQNLKLVFSTGTEIDSLSISGKVNNLWTGMPADQVLVGLYDIKLVDTVPLLLRKPNYFIKTDTSGKYRFENIKSSKYRVIGFRDINQSLTFDKRTEVFGFVKDSISLDSNLTNIDFSVYPYNTDPPKFQRVISRQSNFSIQIDKPFKNIEVEFPNKEDSLTYQIRDQELLFYNHPNTTDTTLTKIIVQDSVGNILEKEQKVYFNTNLRAPNSNELLRISSAKIRPNTTIKKIDHYLLNFEYPILNVDTNKISILSDTITYEPYTLNWLDESQTRLSIEFTNSASRELKLEILEGAITNYKSDSNSTYQLINKLYQQENFGQIDGTYENFTGQKIVHILDEKASNIIDNQIFTDKYTFNELLPGTYRIRIIEDKNENGQWDTADFENNQLPESIIVSKGLIKLKANFQLSDVRID